MTVEYNTSRSEVAAWYWFNWKHNPRLRWAQVRIFAGVVLVMLFLRLRLAPLASHDVVVACLWGLGVLACLPLYPQLKFKPQRRVLSIDDQGISTMIGRLSGQLPWSKVDFVRTTEHSVYIVGKNLNAFIVPQRAFLSTQQRDEFVKLCQGWVQASKSGSAA